MKDKQHQKELYQQLDEALDRVLKGEVIRAVLLDYPGFAREIEPLLRTALAARKAAALKPSPGFRRQAALDFQQAIKDMSVAKAAGEKAPKIKVKKESVYEAPVKEPRSYRRGFFGWGAAWSAGFAVLLVILISGTGVVAAANFSMPDSPLYGVKLATESVQLAFTPSGVAKADLISKFNDRRVDEVVNMANKGLAAEISQLNSRIASNMVKISDLSSDGNTSTLDYANSATKQFSASGFSADSSETALTSPQTTVAATTIAPDDIIKAPTSQPVPAQTIVTVPPATTTTTTIIVPPSAVLPERGVMESSNILDGDKWSALQERLSEKQVNNLRSLLEAWLHAPDWLKPSLEQSIKIIIDGYGLSASNSSIVFQILDSYGLSLRDLGN